MTIDETIAKSEQLKAGVHPDELYENIIQEKYAIKLRN